jgi:hypothetical protein
MLVDLKQGVGLPPATNPDLDFRTVRSVPDRRQTPLEVNIDPTYDGEAMIQGESR